MENNNNQRKQEINTILKTLKESQFKTVIFGLSGSVATIKAKEIVQGLLELNVNVVLIPSQSSRHFLNLEEYTVQPLLQNQTVSSEKPFFAMMTDPDEWISWTKRADSVLHIDLRKLSSLLLIAPLSANTMAKITNGFCDNLLTSVARCWDLKKYPFLVAPAMNTLMYEHPLTFKQLKIMSDELGIRILEPEVKLLMCGDTGKGAMIGVDKIISEVKLALQFTF